MGCRAPCPPQHVPHGWGCAAWRSPPCVHVCVRALRCAGAFRRPIPHSHSLAERGGRVTAVRGPPCRSPQPLCFCLLCVGRGSGAFPPQRRMFPPPQLHAEGAQGCIPHSHCHGSTNCGTRGPHRGAAALAMPHVRARGLLTASCVAPRLRACPFTAPTDMCKGVCLRPTGCACLVGRMRAGVRSTFSAQCAPSGWCIVCAPFWHVSAPDTHWRTLAHPNNTRMRHIGSKTVSWEWGSGIPSCCVA